jgi:hypothetical protein
VPIGLLWSLVLAPAGAGEAELAAAAVRLERYTGDRRMTPAQGRRWADAAIWLLRSLPDEDARSPIERAEGLLRELQLVGYAGLSDSLPSGFAARLSLFGQALDTLLVQPSLAALAGVEQAASQVLRHDLGDRPGTRIERVQMALRLARWLIATARGGFETHPYDKAPVALTLPTLAQGYATDGAYVDWARLKLLGGDELAALSATYRVLAARVRERREAFNQQFAAALQRWNTEPNPAADCLPVESVLGRLLGPLAQQTPVLLLVVGGLSLPVFRELCGDLARAGWVEHIPADAARAWVGIAALPTVTEISRASLLSGRLTVGAAHQEKTSFAAHEGLLAVSKVGGKPILFHKDELGEAGGLAEPVREVIGNGARRVVGLVYNAVDDHLGGSDQLHLRWSLDDLRLLRPLLYEASTAGRTLVITADSGEGAFRGLIDGWFYALEQDVLADGRIEAQDAEALIAATDGLMETRLAAVTKVAPAISATLRAYRRALQAENQALADGLIAWLSGQPNVAAGIRRAAGIKGEIDHFGAGNFLAGLLIILRDSGFAGLLLVLDEVETLQRMRADTREKGLNALRQWIEEINAGRFPGLYLLMTGTPAFFDGPQGAQRLAPLAQRLHTDFMTEARFDNPRAVQIRLPGFDLTLLAKVGGKVRDLYAAGCQAPERVLQRVDDDYLAALAQAVTGNLGGRVGVAPRVFLKKLVGEVLDRVDHYPDFDPRTHYALTIEDTELSAQRL